MALGPMSLLDLEEEDFLVDGLMDVVEDAAEADDEEESNPWIQPSWLGMWGSALAQADHLMLNDYVWGRTSAREVVKALVDQTPAAQWKASLETATRSVVVADIEQLLKQVTYRMTPEDVATAHAYSKAFRQYRYGRWEAAWEARQKDPELEALSVAHSALASRRHTCPKPAELDLLRLSYALYFTFIEHVEANVSTLEVWKLLDGAMAVGREDLGNRLLGDFRATSEWGDEHQSDSGIAARRRIAIVEQQEDLFVHALHGRLSFSDAVSLRGHVVAYAYHLLHGWENHHAHEQSPSAYR